MLDNGINRIYARRLEIPGFFEGGKVHRILSFATALSAASSTMVDGWCAEHTMLSQSEPVCV